MIKSILLILLIIAGLVYYTLTIMNREGRNKVEIPAASVAGDTLPQTRDSLSNAGKNNLVRSGPLPLDSITDFAETLLGVPYLYASSDPQKGFDCSGFITYVFNHFGIEVPRSSVDFTNKGIAIPQEQARRGDLILFTGTDSAATVVGHMGIVLSNSDSLRFIHSSSGKANGVTISPLNEHYLARFVKVISIADGL